MTESNDKIEKLLHDHNKTIVSSLQDLSTEVKLVKAEVTGLRDDVKENVSKISSLESWVSESKGAIHLGRWVIISLIAIGSLTIGFLRFLG